MVLTRSLSVTALDVPVSLDKNLTEAEVRKEQTTISTQTERFAPRPQSPVFIPKKTGIDAETQIEPEDELFDFDAEVAPLVQILVSKTLEQALMEVEEEEELVEVVKAKRVLYNEKAEESERVKNMERKALDRQKAAVEKLRQEQDRVRAEELLSRKIAAVHLASSLVDAVKTSTMGSLEEAGVFYDPLTRLIQTDFLPWIYNNAEEEVQKKCTHRKLVDVLLQNCLERQKQLEKAAQGAESYIRLTLKGQGIPNDTIGPIPVYASDSREDTEKRIRDNVGELTPPPGGYLELAQSS